MHPNYVLVHVKPTLENWLIENGFNWNYSEQHGYDEIDVVVDDIPYECLDGTYQDPDEQLCEHYGIDYNQVNCIEAVY
tara:strand:- start:90 stop:323 length:234 start_codon:yes stop_codon:yes gene_type:complete